MPYLPIPAMSPKQEKIMAFFRQAEGIVLTTKQAVELIGGDIYHNAAKHVGNVLSNMVCKGWIERAGKGRFIRPADRQETLSEMSRVIVASPCKTSRETGHIGCRWSGAWRPQRCIACHGVTPPVPPASSPSLHA